MTEVKAKGGRPTTDRGVELSYLRLRDWGVVQSRAAVLCKPLPRGGQKAKPSALGRTAVIRLEQERTQRPPEALPKGVTVEQLKALPDAALRALAATGKADAAFKRKVTPSPPKPKLSKEQKAAKAEAEQLQRGCSASARSGLFHYTPPTLPHERPLRADELPQWSPERWAEFADRILSPRLDALARPVSEKTCQRIAGRIARSVDKSAGGVEWRMYVVSPFLQRAKPAQPKRRQGRKATV